MKKLLEGISKINPERFSVSDIKFIIRIKFFACIACEMAVYQGLFSKWIEDGVTYYRLIK